MHQNQIEFRKIKRNISHFTGHEKIARLLIHNGADFTIKNRDGKLASELAAQKGNSREVKLTNTQFHVDLTNVLFRFQ